MEPRDTRPKRPRWSDRWRGAIRAAETAVVIGLWAAGLAAGDLVIAAVLLVPGWIVGTIAILAGSSRSRGMRLVLAGSLATWNIGSWCIVDIRHSPELPSGSPPIPTVLSVLAPSEPVASTRPWVKLGSIEIASLEILKAQARVSVKFNYLNIGRSPATHVWVSPRLLVSTQEIGKISNTPVSCANAKERADGITGATLFQGEIGASWVQFGRSLDNMPPWLTATSGYTEFMVAGCIIYTFDGSSDVHLTSFLFNLNRNPNHPEVLPNGNTTITFDIAHPEKIDGDGLQWIEDPFGKFAN
jgi:hypothetical protein